ncbi:MAG: LysM peptidoglycan-binding domain-containing M23 family metallopeptidase [Anaerolineae bacterium]|nr:LysM peptidoglycan-binding domain-containing M23 family metallopeptidase [Anaerolineae bacterium]
MNGSRQLQRPVNIAYWGSAVLLALALFLGAALPTRADGYIVDIRPRGIAGPQADAVAVSPMPAAIPGAASWRTYVVQPGDTLSTIAARSGTDVATLVARNGLESPDRIVPGQVLRLDGEATPGPAFPAGGPLARVHFWPWPPAQGQTLSIWLQSASGNVSAGEPVTFTLTFDGRPYPVHVDGARGWALVPIPPLTPPGPKPLVIIAGDQTWRAEVSVQAGTFPSSNIPASASQPILSATDKVRAEAARMTALFEKVTPGWWTPRSRFTLPLDGDYPRTSPFGSRRTYGNSTAVSAHAGEDFSAPPGTPVYAPADGRVVLAEALFVRGNAVVLDHGNGVYTGYWHLLALDVAEGDQVTRGQLLGKVGSTGLSTGAHLHWELRIAGMAVDPLQWVAP